MAETATNGDGSVAADAGDAADRVIAAGTPAQAEPIERRMVYAQGGNLRHVRHAQVLERWPLLAEPWARRVEEGRLAAVDRTPGAATFGR